MTIAPRSPLDLLDPGALLGGALFGSLLDHVVSGERLLPGTRLGPFRVGEELGRGGMGVVYRSDRDDGEYRQTVAIKCLASSGSAQGLELFRRERQVLAELKHPHIARLLDGGHHSDGRLWFAMELVDGQPIDAHARAGKLPVAERLHLMRQVIDAVAFAHQRLLIHRDIKPGNVLVDADGSVKLLDFGIAALAGDAGATRAYSPAWASPEQRADAEIGPASDQYQLGMLLDAVLQNATGAADPSPTLPCAQGRVGEGSAARGIDPTRWLPIASARRQELVAIASRATAEFADARYGSVAELGAEIDRWLDSRPVAAHGSGIVYTARCSVRRHPLVAALALATVIGIAAMIAGFSWRVARERDLANAAAARAEREAATAQAINAFLNEDLLAAADPYGENQGRVPIGDLLENAVPRVDARLRDRPGIAGEIYLVLGKSLSGLGQLESAASSLDLAVARFVDTYGKDDERTLKARLQRSIVDDLAQRNDVYAEGLARLAADAAVLGASHPLVVEIAGNRAWAAFAQGDFAGAEVLYEAALERATPDLVPTLLADILLGQALTLLRLQRAPEALVPAERAYRLRRDALGANAIDTWLAEAQWANAQFAVGDVEAALAKLAAVHAHLRGHFGEVHNQTVGAAHELGLALVRADRPQQAIAPLEQAVAGKSKLLGALSGATVTSASVLGNALTRAGQLDEAQRVFDSLAGFAPQTPYDQRTLAILLRNRGELALAEKNWADAVRLCREGMAITAQFASAISIVPGLEVCIGLAAVEQGESARATELLSRHLESFREQGVQGAFQVARIETALRNLAM